MKLRYRILAAGLMTMPVAANADVNGLYVSLGGGLGLMESVGELQAYSGTLTPNPGFAINVGNVKGTATYNHVGPTYYNTGPVFSASIGWGFSNGVRLELEGSYSQNGVTRLNNGLKNGLGTDPLGLAYTGNEKKYSLLANAIYDFNDIGKSLGLPFTPYIGAGVGFSVVSWDGVTRFGAGEDFTGAGLGIVQKITNAFYGSDLTLAVQGIAGASYDVPGIPGLAITADFRALDLPQGFTQKSHLTLNFRSSPTPFASTLTGNGSSNWGDELTYRFMMGIRYSFGAPPPPVAEPAAPIVAAVAPSPVSRSYIVFFDWDKATLTERAQQIVAEAAANSTKVQFTRLEVNGYTDASGTAAYNQALSIRRAHAVAAQLVRDGVPKTAISIQGFGESHPLVPTAAGVREPQNRRVEIIIK